MKKQSRKRRRTRSKPKPKEQRSIRAPRPSATPKDLKPYVLKKFRSRVNRRMSVLAVRLPDGSGHTAVATVMDQTPTIIREFDIPNGHTELPDSMWRAAQADLAIWCARYMARYGQPPSVRKERGRRKKIWKEALRRHQEYMGTKTMMRAVKGEIKPLRPPEPPVLHTFICIYDPNGKLGDTVFRLHGAACPRLDFERRKAIRDYGGSSWVLEARSASQAVADQVKEFDEDDMGYDSSDFAIHKCSLNLQEPRERRKMRRRREDIRQAAQAQEGKEKPAATNASP